MGTITRKDLADELASELSAIADRLDEKFDKLRADWSELSREEQHATASLKSARDNLRAAVEELDGNL